MTDIIFSIVMILLFFFLVVALPVGIILLIGYIVIRCTREAKKPYDPNDQNRY